MVRYRNKAPAYLTARGLRMPTLMNMRITNRIKLDVIERHDEVGGEEGEI